jgi:hypothetical protein
MKLSVRSDATLLGRRSSSCAWQQEILPAGQAPRRGLPRDRSRALVYKDLHDQTLKLSL